jgi:DNA-binding response OmpR family regulator
MINAGSTILIAEDDQYFVTPVKFYLLDQGFEVKVVTDAEFLVKGAQGVSALIVDARLTLEGGEKGCSTVAKMIEDRVIGQDVPVVFVSVLAEEADVFQRSLNLPVLRGRYDWVQKPYEASYLLEVIRQQKQRLTSQRGA